MIANELDSDSPYTTTTTTTSSSSYSSRGTSKESTPPTPPDTELKSSVVAPPQPATPPANPKKTKKNKPLSRAPIATGISTNIPVTGEKPRPVQEGDASLEDNVLYTIFLILFEQDAAEEGMTVKQLCEKLETLHPELVNMSSKTSNLVSAKLNAYIKKLEKADLTLQYAISREWADASPKRMVYKYRGLLAPGWEKVLDELKKIENAKQQLEKQQQDSEDQEIAEQSSDGASADDESSEMSPQVTRKNSTVGVKAEKSPVKQTPTPVESPPSSTAMSTAPIPPTTTSNITKRRATMFDMGRPTLEEFCVPYDAAPVVASLNVFHDDTDKIGTRQDQDDEDVVLEDVLDHSEHQQVYENTIRIKKRRLTWTPSPFSFTSSNRHDDDLGLAAFRALSAGGSGKKKKWFELTEMPKPELTSLSELEKYWD